MMDATPAGLIPEQLLIEIDALLYPDNVLHRDIRDLAGILEFNMAEIRYMCVKEHPFNYMLDQWCRRIESEATLEKLLEAVIELKRPDVAEIIKDAIREVKEASYEKLQKLVNIQNERMDKVDSTGFIEMDKKQHRDDTQNCKKHCDTDSTMKETKNLSAFIVYFPEDENHSFHVRNFVEELHSYDIDIKIDLFETLQAAQSKQLYVMTNLKNCDYVIVICSPSLILCEKLLKQTSTPKISDKMKELKFTTQQILGHIYRDKNCIYRYIPVILPNCSLSSIPKYLVSPKSYCIPDDYEKLVRRMHKVESYKLPSTKSKSFRPMFSV